MNHSGFLNSMAQRCFLGRSFRNTSRRVSSFLKLGGSWNKIGPHFLSRAEILEKSRCKGSSASFSLLM